MSVLSWKHPSTISRTRNVLWNAPINVAQALLPLAVVPLYIRLLGPDAYGLIVLNATILATVLFLDRLMNPVIVREFGRKNGEASASADMGHLLRSFEGLAVALGLAVTAGVALALPLIASSWTAGKVLDTSQASLAFLLMGLSLGLQWPGFLYTAALVGLQRQALSSGLRLAGAVLQHGGGVAVLLVLGPNVVLLLAWQALAMLLTSLALRVVAWRTMPQTAVRPIFSPAILRGVWRMAVGSLLIGVAAALISQLDKLVVARLAPPDQFTAYGLSFMAAGAAFNVLSGPLVSAMQPHFARLLEARDQAALAGAYHRWTQVFALLAMPLAGLLAGFSGPFVDLWLGEGSATGALVKRYLPVATLGLLLITLLGPAAVLQGAAGWNGMMLACHAATIAVMLLGLPIVVSLHGPQGAAWLSAGLVSTYFLVMVPLMHRRLLRGELARALILGLLVPLLITGAIFWLVSAAMPILSGPWVGAVLGVATAGITFIILLCVLPDGRQQFADSLGFLLRRRD